MSNSVMPVKRDEVFSRVPKSTAPRVSTFDRSHRHLTAIDASYLYPVFVDEVYPGDVFKLTGRHLNRLLTPIKPFYDNLRAKYYFFYCPNRLVWNNWTRLMGERRRPDEDVTDTYQTPMLNSGSTGVAVGSIFDYAGIPVNVPNLEFSALPFRAINLCYNEWFRDENLSDWLNVGGVDVSGSYDKGTEFGDSDQLSNYKLFKVAKSHDYFTSCLPFQQLGPAQTLSIGGQADIYGYQNNINGLGVSNPMLCSGVPTDIALVNSQGTTRQGISASVPSKINGAYADLTTVTGFTMSDFRTSMQLQALKELNARMGHRYKEIIYGEFDVTISDATLDRPEFLGSYSVYFNTVPIPSTAETADNPQGNLAAYSYTPNVENYGFSKGFEEHGYVIGFCAVTTDQSYQQGLNRMWSRKNKYDYYTPLLADISEQAVKQKEILAQGGNVLSADGTPVDEKTLGYQEAFAELRYKPNMITGRMRSQSPLSLDVWHLGTEFSPTIDSVTGENLGIPLNQDFIEDNTEQTLDRVIADNSDEPQIFSDNYFQLHCTRELPIYSVPAFLMGRL